MNGVRSKLCDIHQREGSSCIQRRSWRRSGKLIGCGSGNRVIEVDRFGKVVWIVEKNERPGITLACAMMVERLPNGNTTLVNSRVGPANPQIIEATQKRLSP
jgi:hypothetical protein